MPCLALAQEFVKPVPLDPDQTRDAFAVRAPDEGSPFFAERQATRALSSRQGREAAALQTVAVYPQSSGSPGSASTMVRNFFTEMFSSIRIRRWRMEKTTQRLEIDPAEFSLQDRREVNVTFIIRNNTRKIMRFDYPTTQRIEILTKDSAGNVIERWSDDRAFDEREGVLFINPGERVEYAETVPTRDMKPGETYIIEGEVPDNPDLTTSRPVTPQP